MPHEGRPNDRCPREGRPCGSVYPAAMTAATRVADPGSWRPQSFGGRRAQEIPDPLIEPLWDGDRVLVHASSAGIAILDAEGVDVDALPEVAGAVADALMAEDAVIDGYLTPQAARSSEGAVLGEVKVPTSREMTAQIFIGRGRDRRRELAESEAPVVRPGDPLVLVCVDLLAIDGAAPPRRPPPGAQAPPGERDRREPARPHRRLRPSAGRPLDRLVAGPGLPGAGLQGGQQSLPPRRGERGLGDRPDPEALSARTTLPGDLARSVPRASSTAGRPAMVGST